MAKDNRITLYDLQLATGATISPFIWATKYAIAHKGFEMDVVPGGFTGILERTGGKTERLPAIVDDGEWVLDSWLIAEYLDDKYPDRPTLIPNPSVKVLITMTESWLWEAAIRPWMSAFILQYWGRSLPQDHAYVRSSRERMFGRPFEEVVVGRDDRIAKVPPTLQLMRNTLAQSQWLGGKTPNYADYRMLAVFLFTASIADTPVLTDDDPLRDWIERGFDLYGGLGRHQGLSQLFGLQLRTGDPEPYIKGPLKGGLSTRNTGPESTAAETARLAGR